MNSSIWPYDTIIDPIIEPKSENDLVCFVISPFDKEFDDVLTCVRVICNQIGNKLSVNFNCIRADKITSAGIIHPEIWNQIKTANVIVSDVTGENGNVMMELGVASACRRKESIIIIRQKNPEEKFLFDINPARHLEYEKSVLGDKEFIEKLDKVIHEALTDEAFGQIPEIKMSLPLKIDFASGKDSDILFSPSITHRRIIENYLDFGAMYVFKNSWLSIGNLKIKNVKLKMDMCFTNIIPNIIPDKLGWIGIMLRCQSFFANYGHLVYLRGDGSVFRTVPENEKGKYHDEKIGKIPNFNPEKKGFINFEISFDEIELKIKVDDVEGIFMVKDLKYMPYVFNKGRILIQTYLARVGIRHIEIEDI